MSDHPDFIELGGMPIPFKKVMWFDGGQSGVTYTVIALPGGLHCFEQVGDDPDNTECVLHYVSPCEMVAFIMNRMMTAIEDFSKTAPPEIDWSAIKLHQRLEIVDSVF